jgi:hypothetical protein
MRLSKWPYVKIPLIISALVGIAVFVFSSFQSFKELKSITKNLNGIIINISLTFIAFSVTALSLLSFVYNQAWFKKVAKSIYFESFIDRFFMSTKCTLALLIVSIITLLIEPYYTIIICSFINAIFISSFIFLSLWTWRCIDDLMDIYKE